VAAVLVFQPERIDPGFPCGHGTWSFKRGLLVAGVRTIDRCPEIGWFVVVVPEYKDLADEVVVWAGQSTKYLGLEEGEPSLWGSVRAAVRALPREIDVVLVHDVARPVATPGLFARVVQALEGADAVVPQMPVTDTVKRVESGVVRETIPRGRLAAVQTPQAFRRRTLEAGSEEPPGPGAWTDPLTFVPAIGLRLDTIPGEPGNVAVRSPEHRRLVEAVWAGRLAGPHGR
jgi:2-C-methyl-D-erythritol 4-phosphate cytidylyltransferase